MAQLVGHLSRIQNVVVSNPTKVYFIITDLPCVVCVICAAIVLLPSPFPQTTILNKYLQEQMEGLTAKVFRTFNASITLQEQLEELTQGKPLSPLYTVL